VIRRSTPLPKTPEPIDVGLRHDMPLVNWDVEVSFSDGTATVLRVQARNPVGATRLSCYSPEREWPAERLLSVRALRVRRAS